MGTMSSIVTPHLERAYAEPSRVSCRVCEHIKYTFLFIYIYILTGMEKRGMASGKSVRSHQPQISLSKIGYFQEIDPTLILRVRSESHKNSEIEEILHF